MNHIFLNNQDVAYSLKVSRRARSMRISVSCDAGLVVTVPWGINPGRFENFLKEKSNWIVRKLDDLKRFAGQPVIKTSKREYKKLKTDALHLAVQKVGQWNRLYNFQFSRISIKNQKTRWGSCSKKGNLNFNYKIIHLPENLLDYLIVHELCHLKEFNHSREFWSLVEKALPDYKNLRKALKSMNMVQY